MNVIVHEIGAGVCLCRGTGSHCGGLGGDQVLGVGQIGVGGGQFMLERVEELFV